MGLDFYAVTLVVVHIMYMVNSSSFLEDVWHDGHEMLNQICKALGA
jgi:hypothetical protein